MRTDNSGICISLEKQANPFRTIGLGSICNHNIADKSSDIVLHLHIRVDISRAAHFYGQRTLQQPKRIKVGMIDIGRHRTNKLLGIHEGIYIELTAKQLVTAFEVYLRTSLADDSKGSQVTHVPQAGLQLVDINRRHDISLRCKHIDTMTIDHDTCINIIEEALRHEMIEVDVLDTDAGTIVHLIGIKITNQLHISPTLTGLDIS